MKIQRRPHFPTLAPIAHRQPFERVPVAPPVEVFQIIEIQFVVELARQVIDETRVVILATGFYGELNFFEHRKRAQTALRLVQIIDAVVARHASASDMEETRGEQFFVFQNVKLHPETRHNAAEKTKKTVDAHRTVVHKALGVLFEQHLVRVCDLNSPAYHRQILIAPNAFPLAFAEAEIFQINPQHHHPAGHPAPFPVIAPENQIRPIAPAILAKAVEHHRMQRLHRDILLDVVRVERDVAENGEGFRVQNFER